MTSFKDATWEVFLFQGEATISTHDDIGLEWHLPHGCDKPFQFLKLRSNSLENEDAKKVWEQFASANQITNFYFA